MKRFLVNFIAFTFFVSLVYIALLLVWGKLLPSAFNLNLIVANNQSYTQVNLSEVKKFKDVDILFLGSSRAYGSFDTRFYQDKGLSVFNLGTIGQTPIQTKLLLHRYLEMLNPKRIVYEIAPMNLSSDGVESACDILANDLNDRHSLKMMVDKPHLKIINTGIFAFFNSFFNKDATPQSKRKKGKYCKGGFVFFESLRFKEKAMKEPLKKAEFDKNQLKSFKAIIDILKDKNIELMLVQVPFAKKRYAHYSNLNDLFDAKMESYSTYYNFNKLLNLKDSLHFRDATHLNQNGVDIFNAKLYLKLE